MRDASRNPTDMTLRIGRYIPDAALAGDARIERMEAYLVGLSEELEQLLPLSAVDTGSAVSDNRESEGNTDVAD